MSRQEKRQLLSKDNKSETRDNESDRSARRMVRCLTVKRHVVFVQKTTTTVLANERPRPPPCRTEVDPVLWTPHSFGYGGVPWISHRGETGRGRSGALAPSSKRKRCISSGSGARGACRYPKWLGS